MSAAAASPAAEEEEPSAAPAEALPAKRVRRAPIKFIPTAPVAPPVARPAAGAGVALGSVPNISHQLAKVASKNEEVVLLHRALFGSPGVSGKRKGDIRTFCGWADPESPRKASDKLGRAVMAVLKKVAALLDLSVGGKKDALVEGIVEYLKKPRIVEGRVNLAAREERKREKMKRKRERMKKLKGRVEKKTGQRKKKKLSKKPEVKEGESVGASSEDSEEYSDVEYGIDEDFEMGWQAGSDAETSEKSSRKDLKVAEKIVEKRRIPRSARSSKLKLQKQAVDSESESSFSDAESDRQGGDAPAAATRGVRVEKKKTRKPAKITNAPTAKTVDDSMNGMRDSAKDTEPSTSREGKEDEQDIKKDVISDETLVKEATALVEGANLEHLTMRKLREKLEAKFNIKFSKEQKTLIKSTVSRVLKSL